MAPGTTSTIDDDEPAPRQGSDALAQLPEAVLSGGSANIFRTRNMRLRKHHMRTNLNDERPLALGRLKNSDQVHRVDSLCGCYIACLGSKRQADHENYGHENYGHQN
jgi:hypothetical protein